MATAHLSCDTPQLLSEMESARTISGVRRRTGWLLTVKLNGRPEAQWARQSDSTLKAHQAPSHAEFHGPFQRLLERTHQAYCARAAVSRPTKDHAVTKYSAPPRSNKPAPAPGPGNSR